MKPNKVNINQLVVKVSADKEVNLPPSLKKLSGKEVVVASSTAARWQRNGYAKVIGKPKVNASSANPPKSEKK